MDEWTARPMNGQMSKSWCFKDNQNTNLSCFRCNVTCLVRKRGTLLCVCICLREKSWVEKPWGSNCNMWRTRESPAVNTGETKVTLTKAEACDVEDSAFFSNKAAGWINPVGWWGQIKQTIQAHTSIHFGQ